MLSRTIESYLFERTDGECVTVTVEVMTYPMTGSSWDGWTPESCDWDIKGIEDEQGDAVDALSEQEEDRLNDIIQEGER